MKICFGKVVSNLVTLKRQAYLSVYPFLGSRFSPSFLRFFVSSLVLAEDLHGRHEQRQRVDYVDLQHAGAAVLGLDPETEIEERVWRGEHSSLAEGRALFNAKAKFTALRTSFSFFQVRRGATFEGFF